jgi:hypothetical protein
MHPQNMPLEEQEWGEPGRYLDARFDPRVEPPLPSFLRSPRASRVDHDHIGAERPSTGWQLLRTLGWIFIPVLVGIGAGLAWQSRDAAARDVIVGQVPSLGWLLSTTKPPAIAATAPDPVPQLEPVASNFDVIRHNVEQLAARQEQMAQNIALLQAVADDIRDKMSTPPSSLSQQQADPAQQRYAPPAKAPASAMQSSAMPSSAMQSSSVPRSPPAVGAALPAR